MLEVLKLEAERKVKSYPIHLQEKINETYASQTVILKPLPSLKKALKMKCHRLIQVLRFCPYSDLFLLPEEYVDQVVIS